MQTAVRLPRRAVRFWIAGTALLAAAGALWLLVRPVPRVMRAAGEGTRSLPDVPSPQEQALLRSLVTARPGDPEPGRALGDFYVSGARPFEALWAYSFALHAQPDGPSVNLGLARALEASLLFDAAIGRLRAVLAREPGQREVVDRLAELYLRTGRPEAALEAARGAGAAFLATREGAVLEGTAREARGDVEGAEQAYRRALEQARDDADTWHRLGLLLLSSARRSEALQALDQAHSLDPRDPRYATDLGRVLAASPDPKDRQGAMQLYRAAVHDRPYGPAYYQSGLLLAAEKRLPEAAEGFARATAAGRGSPEAYRELAGVLEILGRRAEAHYQRGLYYSVKDLRVRSLREYLAMAAADPSRPDGLLMASQSHFKMMQKAPSVARARQALARDPHDRRAREMLAAALIVIHDRKGAKQVCEEWLRQEPGSPRARWLLGRIAIEEMRFDEGIRDYEQSLAREPDNPDVLESLGAALVEAPGTERLPRAIETLSRLVTLAPERAQARHQLGLALMRAGRLAEAQRELLRSLDLDPNQSETCNVVVQLARRLRQPGPVAFFGPIVRAVEDRLRDELLLWRRTWEQPDDPSGYVALAQFLIRTAELRKAESQLEQALALQPHRPAVAADLARVRRLLAVQQ